MCDDCVVELDKFQGNSDPISTCKYMADVIMKNHQIPLENLVGSLQSRLSEAERLLERAEKFIYGVSQNKSFFGHEQKLSAQELIAEIKKFREGK